MAVEVILVPTDFSNDSEQALRFACSLARDQIASVVVVHVLPGTKGSTGTLAIDDDSQVASQYQEQFGRMKTHAGKIPVTFRLIRGNTVAGIRTVAAEEQADLIVIGSHCDAHVPLLGSVTEGVLRQAECPVMILRQPGRSRKSGHIESRERQVSGL
jgi:nucleotide-binding universal stress UspA family protein